MQIKRSDLIIVPCWSIAIITGHLIVNFGFEGFGQLLLRTAISATLMGGCAIAAKRMRSVKSNDYIRTLGLALIIMNLMLPAMALGITAVFGANVAILQLIGYGTLFATILMGGAMLIGAIGGLTVSLVLLARKRYH